MIEQLLLTTFLGLEIAEDEFAFAEDPRDLRRFRAMSQALESRRGVSSRLKVHPAYHAFLGMSDSVGPQMPLT